MNTIRLNTIGTPFPKAEGGGGDTPSGGGNVEYIDFVAASEGMSDSTKAALLCFSYETRGEFYGTLMIAPTSYLVYALGGANAVVSGAKAIAIDFSAFLYEGESFTIQSALNLTDAQIAAFPRITKEEFYNTTA